MMAPLPRRCTSSRSRRLLVREQRDSGADRDRLHEMRRTSSISPASRNDCASLAPPATKMSPPGAARNLSISAAGDSVATRVPAQSASVIVVENTILSKPFRIRRHRPVGGRPVRCLVEVVHPPHDHGVEAAQELRLCGEQLVVDPVGPASPARRRVRRRTRRVTPASRARFCASSSCMVTASGERMSRSAGRELWREVVDSRQPRGRAAGAASGTLGT